MAYLQPLNISKNEIRIVQIITENGELPGKIDKIKKPNRLIKLRMKTVSLDDITARSLELMKENGTSSPKSEHMMKNLKGYKELGIESTIERAKKSDLSKNDRAELIAKVKEFVEQATKSEKFGRWNWGDYRILSYVWGDASLLQKIIVNDFSIYVTQNLWDFLNEFILGANDSDHSSSSRVWWWIDALCINQNDLKERAAQVKRMGTIYEQALDCVAWLGPAQNDSDKAFDLLSAIAEQQFPSLVEAMSCMHRISEDINIFGDGAWRAFAQLMSRPYWLRLWVMQEIALSANHMTIACGGKFMQWTTAYRVVELISYDLGAFIGIMRKTAGPFLKQCVSQVSRIQQLHVFVLSKIPGKQSLSTVLSMSRSAKQADFRDKVYGILSLIDPAIVELVKVDYMSSVDDVFIDFTKNVITATSSLEILCLNKSGSNKARTLPSWVLDLRTVPEAQEETSVQLSYLTSRGSTMSVSFKGKTMVFRGFMFDKVDGLSTAFPFDADDPLNQITLPELHTANAYQNTVATREAIWRSLVANRDGKENLAPEK